MGEGVIAGVIQVRMGSTRLPGKALRPLLGRPLLERLYERMSASKLLERVVIATGEGPENIPIVEWARGLGIGCFAGSETDLVDRLFRTARLFSADVLVRVTGDCPLADPEVIDQVIRAYWDDKDRLDYVTNALKPTYPDGLDVDVFSSRTLERMRREVSDPFWREWFTSYLREHPSEYRAVNVERDDDLSALRWTVDYEEDFRFVEEVFSGLYPKKKIFLMKDILALLEENPALAEINRKYARDAAYSIARKEAGK